MSWLVGDGIVLLDSKYIKEKYSYINVSTLTSYWILSSNQTWKQAINLLLIGGVKYDQTSH